MCLVPPPENLVWSNCIAPNGSKWKVVDKEVVGLVSHFLGNVTVNLEWFTNRNIRTWDWLWSAMPNDLVQSEKKVLVSPCRLLDTSVKHWWFQLCRHAIDAGCCLNVWVASSIFIESIWYISIFIYESILTSRQRDPYLVCRLDKESRREATAFTKTFGLQFLNFLSTFWSRTPTQRSMWTFFSTIFWSHVRYFTKFSQEMSIYL